MATQRARRRNGRRQPGLATNRGTQRLPDIHRCAAEQTSRIAQQLQHFRCPHEQVRHQPRRAEQERQPFHDRAFVAQNTEVPRCVFERLRDFPIGQQTAVRVRGIGKQVEQDRKQCLLDCGAARHTSGERLDVLKRAIWRRVAERRQPALGLLRRQAQCFGRHVRDGLQQGTIEQLFV